MRLFCFVAGTMIVSMRSIVVVVEAKLEMTR